MYTNSLEHPKKSNAWKLKVSKQIDRLLAYPKIVVPQYIDTGYEGYKLPFPSDTYVGPPEHFYFGLQTKKYNRLKEVLEAHGLQFTLVGASMYQQWSPDKHPRFKFVAIAGDINKPDFIWQRDDGECHPKKKDTHRMYHRIYTQGKMFQIEDFLHMDVLKKFVLLS